MIQDRSGRPADLFDVKSPIAHGALEPLHVRHSADVVKWRNDPRNTVWFTTQHHFTVEGQQAWLSKVQASGVDYNWIIEDPHAKAIGTIGLYNIDTTAGQAEIGRILIGEESARGKGYAKAAVVEVMRLARAAGLPLVYLFVVETNQAALGLYAGLGFKPAGIQDGVIKMVHADG